MYADASDKMPRLPRLAHLAPVMQAPICFNLETTSTKMSTVKQGTSEHFGYRPGSEHYLLHQEYPITFIPAFLL